MSDRELAYFLMYKTDSFLHENPNSKKVAAKVTGLQQPPTWVSQLYQQQKVCVLNADVQIDESGSYIRCHHDAVDCSFRVHILVSKDTIKLGLMLQA